MIKCGVCGSENEAQALFCGTCGSPLNPADAKPIVEEAKPVAPQPTGPDESVVPGKGGARRDLGIGGGTATSAVTKEVTTGTQTEPVGTETSGFPGPTVVCSVCATVNDATRTYCRKCANELKPAAAAAPAPSPAQPGRRISPTIIGLAAAGVVVAIGVAVIFALSGGGPGPSGSPTAASPGLTAQTTTGPVVETPTASEAVEPTEAPFAEGDPTGRIVFSRCDGPCLLFMINADGSEVGALTSSSDGPDLDPYFSSDGTRIAFQTRDGIRILDIESGDITTVSSTEGDSGPAWSPDDSQLTYAGHRNSDPKGPKSDLEIRLDGITTSGPSEPLTANKLVDVDPIFTPDGKSIIWVQGSSDDRELKMIDLATRKITSLTNDNFHDLDPAISPDGTKLAFVSHRESGDEFDLFLMDLATREITALPSVDGDDHDPTWSPGGRYIVFSSGQPEGEKDLFILDLADMSLDPLTQTPGRDIQAHWHE